MTTAPNQPVTDRQLAASVRFGRKITVVNHDFSDVPLSGYVSGWDDENIFLAIPVSNGTIRQVLINRDFISGIELPDITTLSSEAPNVRAQLEALFRKFKKSVIEEYFPDRVPSEFS